VLRDFEAEPSVLLERKARPAKPLRLLLLGRTFIVAETFRFAPLGAPAPRQV